jgi:hypothetical protein
MGGIGVACAPQFPVTVTVTPPAASVINGINLSNGTSFTIPANAESTIDTLSVTCSSGPCTGATFTLVPATSGACPSSAGNSSFAVSGTNLNIGGTTINDTTARTICLEASIAGSANFFAPFTLTGRTFIVGRTCGAPNPDTGGDISVDYSQGCSAWNTNFWSGIATVKFPGAAGAANGNAQAIPIKFQRTFWSPNCWSTGPGTQNYYCNPGGYGGDDLLDIIHNMRSSAVLDLEVGGNIGGNWEQKCLVGNGGDENIPCNANEHIQVYVDGLTHLAQKYPEIRYIEGAENEPEGRHWALSTVEEITRRAIVAANQVNAALGSKHFLVGGPAYEDCRSDIVDYVADLKANGTPVDFITFHAYHDTLTNCVLWNAGKPGLTNLPEFVTEWGGYNEGLENAFGEAAFVAQDYYGILTNNLDNITYGFAWEDLSYVDFWPGNDAQVGPEYNVDKMLSMHKAQRISPSAVTGPASNFHPIATKDGIGVALSLSTYGATGSFNVHLNNLPAAFSAATFTWTEYLIDSTHGNCYADCSNNGHMPIVGSGSNPASSSFSLPINMNDGNAMLLLVLTHG